MMDVEKAQAFYARVTELAAVIDAPEIMTPRNDGDGSSGINLEVSDGVYRLTYSEKGLTDVLAEDRDPEAVMEAVFVHITEQMASEQTAELVSADFNPLSLTIRELQGSAMELHARVSSRQQALLSRLSKDWVRRQEQRNLAREQHIENFFKS